MTKENYISLLFDPYKDNKKFYKNCIIRAMHKSKENELIGNYEFLIRCIDIVNECIDYANDFYKSVTDEVIEKIDKYENSQHQEYHIKYLEDHQKNEPKFTYKSVNKQYYALENDNISVCELSEILKELKSIYSEIYSMIKSEDLNFNEILNLSTFNAEIFRNELAYRIFMLYINEYKNEEKKQATFSFLFDAMTKFKLIHCTARKFIEELERYDIFIDRIDFVQCYQLNNEKSMLFNYRYNYVFGSFPVN